MAHTGNLLQKVMGGTGAQCMGRVGITSPVLRQVSPAVRAHCLKEEKVGQSAAAENTRPQQAAEHAYIPEKGGPLPGSIARPPSRLLPAIVRPLSGTLRTTCSTT